MMCYNVILVFNDGHQLSFEIEADSPYLAICDLYNNTNINFSNVIDIICLFKSEE